nr:hypothetical protein [Pseudomonas sp. B28(2017)]
MAIGAASSARRPDLARVFDGALFRLNAPESMLSDYTLLDISHFKPTLKVQLDGHDQTPVITGKSPSNRHEIFYFGESALSAIRIDDFKYRFNDQPGGWLGTR